MFNADNQGSRIVSLLLTAGVAAGSLLVGPGLSSARAAEPSKGWESTASTGLTLTRGNSRNVLVTAGLQSTRKWERDEVFLGANAGYGKNTTGGADQKTDDYLKGNAQWNRLLNERLYAGVRLDAVHDDVADLDYRVTLSPLLGYYFLKDEKFRLSMEAGPSFVYERVGGEETGYIGARLGERFEWKINERAKLWQTAEVLTQVDDPDNYLVNAELGIDSAITERVHLRVVLQDTYDHEPAPGRQKNDLKLIAALAYKF
jgi:putative salt-induced outer membrane protein YdiY